MKIGLNLLLFFSCCFKLLQAQLFTSDNVSHININDVSHTTCTLTVSNVGQITQAFFIETSINHTFINDLEMYIESPQGMIIKLVDNKGGSGGLMWAGFVGTIWSDASSDTMKNSVTTTTQDFKPIGSLAITQTDITPNISTLSQMIGSNANGAWILHVFDDKLGDIGYINWWSISFSGVYNASDLSIPDASPNSGVSSVLTVSGMPTTLTNAQNIVLIANIAHEFDADLDLYLEAPNGAILRLSTDNGNSEMDYATRFNDDCLYYVQSYTSPFWGYLKPEGGTSTENGLTPTITTFNDLNGINPNGNWTLKAFDDTDGDLGKIHFWGLDLKASALTSISKQNDTQQSDIQVYPNPTEDKLHVLSSLPSTIKLLDLTGRLLKTMFEIQTSHVLNLSEYPAGIYLLEVEVNGKVEVKKVIRR